MLDRAGGECSTDSDLLNVCHCGCIGMFICISHKRYCTFTPVGVNNMTTCLMSMESLPETSTVVVV